MRLFYPSTTKFLDEIKDGSSILDIGSLNYTLYNILKERKPNLIHFGIDYMDNTTESPKNYTFKKTDLNKEPIPFEDNTFDYVYASHVIEHLQDPINFFSECIRVLKPNGKILIMAPSEIGLSLKGMSFNYDNFRSISFFDDPTHVMRPWTPQSFYRLAKYFDVIPIEVGYVKSVLFSILAPFVLPFAKITKNDALYEKYLWNSKGWTSFIILTKGYSEKPVFRYYIPNRK